MPFEFWHPAWKHRERFLLLRAKDSFLIGRVCFCLLQTTYCQCFLTIYNEGKTTAGTAFHRRLAFYLAAERENGFWRRKIARALNSGNDSWGSTLEKAGIILALQEGRQDDMDGEGDDGSPPAAA